MTLNIPLESMSCKLARSLGRTIAPKMSSSILRLNSKPQEKKSMQDLLTSTVRQVEKVLPPKGRPQTEANRPQDDLICSLLSMLEQLASAWKSKSLTGSLHVGAGPLCRAASTTSASFTGAHTGWQSVAQTAARLLEVRRAKCFILAVL